MPRPWLKNSLSKRAREGVRQTALPSSACKENGRVYGYRKLHDSLLDQGEISCPNRIARLARMAGIKAQIGYKRRPDSYSGEPSIVVDNTLARQFDVDVPDSAWMTDITNVRPQEGFAYLAMAIDLFSRRLLGDPEAAMVALDGRRDGLALVGLATGATSEWIGGHLNDQLVADAMTAGSQ